MSWLNQHRNAIRAIALLLFLLAMAGPWMFDRIHVPAEYECSAPVVRLEGDFCGLPMSGIKVFTWFGLGLIEMIARLFSGTNAEGYNPRLREYLVALFFVFPPLPFLSNLLMIVRRESRRLQVTNLVFWGVACLLILPLLISSLGAGANKLWGLWVYFGLTICMGVLELLILKGKSSLER